MTFQAQRDYNSVLDWTIDWTDWLSAGETISTVGWTQTGTAVTLSNPTVDGTAKKATVTVSGGSENTMTAVRCTITTSAARTDARSVLFRNVRR